MAHIFVVDDDEQLLRMVGLMLQRGGHTPTLVSNPIEALDMMREDPPEMAIVDVMMPGMNGLELCQELRKHPSTKSMPIIVLTARGPIEDKREALKIGADSYLNKPVTSIELLETVKSLLEGTSSPENANLGAQTEPLVSKSDTAKLGGERGKTITFFSFSGGVGRTTLAVNLALHLNALESNKVCLVDLTSSGGQAAMQLKLQPKAGWNNLLPLENFSGLQLGKEVVEHDSGLRILPAPPFPAAPDLLTIAAVKKILSTLIKNYTHVVFDLPAVLTPAVKYILEHVDVALHVIRPEVMAVQTAIRVEKQMNEHGPNLKSRYFVINQNSPDARLEPATVQRGLNQKIDFVISFDKGQMRAVVQGQPLATGGGQSPIPLGIAQIVENVTQPVAVKTP